MRVAICFLAIICCCHLAGGISLSEASHQNAEELGVNYYNVTTAALPVPTTTSSSGSFPVGLRGEVIIPAWFVNCMASKGCTIKLDKLFPPGTQVEMDPAIFGTDLATTPLIQLDSGPMSPRESREYQQCVADCLAQSPQNANEATDADYWTNRGNIFYSEGKCEEAVAAYDEALRLDPENTEAQHKRDLALQNLARYDAARSRVAREPESDPDDGNAWNVKAMALYEQGKYDEAIQACDEAIQLDPKNVSAWNYKGNIFLSEGKYDEAILSYDEAIRLNPEVASPWYNRGLVLAVQGKYDEAILAFDEAIRLDSVFAWPWYNKGLALYNQGNYTGAIKAYDEAIRLDPEYVYAWYNKGRALVDLGKYDEALACFDKAIWLNPDYADAWLEKSQVYRLLGLHSEAEAALMKAESMRRGFTSSPT